MADRVEYLADECKLLADGFHNSGSYEDASDALEARGFLLDAVRSLRGQA